MKEKPVKFDTKTKSMMDTWLDDFKMHGIIQRACDNTGIDREKVEKCIEKHDKFRERMERGKRMAADYLEAELRDRVLTGRVPKRDSKGNIIPGEYEQHRVSDTLAGEMLRAKKQEEYGKDAKAKTFEFARVIVFKSDVPMPTDDQTAKVKERK